MSNPMELNPRALFVQLSILARKNFARLWYGQIISSLGDRFYQFALLYVILGIKQGMEVGKDSARVTFPARCCRAWCSRRLYGWTVDRFSRRWVMFYADLARAALTLSFLYLWFEVHSSASRVYAVVFPDGRAQRAFHPGAAGGVAADCRPAINS